MSGTARWPLKGIVSVVVNEYERDGLCDGGG